MAESVICILSIGFAVGETNPAAVGGRKIFDNSDGSLNMNGNNVAKEGFYGEQKSCK